MMIVTVFSTWSRSSDVVFSSCDYFRNVFILNKLSPSNIELIVADSRNVSLVNLDIEKARENPKYTEEYKQSVYMSYLERAKRNIEAFATCAQGTDIRQIYVDWWVMRILTSFQKYAKENGASSAALVKHWLKYYCPPRMILKDHVKAIKKIGARYISETCLYALVGWICDVRMYQSLDGCEGLSRLLDELSEFTKYMS